MRIAAHLCTSRHGVFYFRWPLSRHLHPARKATDIKLSLGTRLPHMAEQLSRLMVLAGHRLTFPASLRAMRHDEIRQHVHSYFRGQLTSFKERIAATGPGGIQAQRDFEAALSLAESPLDDFMLVHCSGDGPNMLTGFLDQSELDRDLPTETVRSVAAELQKAYRAVLAKALSHSDDLTVYDFEDPPAALPPAQTVAPAQSVEASELLSEVASKYLAEGRRTGEWRAKTISEKQEALELLQEVIGNKTVSAVSKADARKAKDALLRLPKNRSKNPATRGLPLQACLELKGMPLIHARTINSYLSHFQSFMQWATKQGYCRENHFKELRVTVKAAAADEERKAFTAEQLQMLYLHLTNNPSGLVEKEDHKWPTLISMFTGARLNEIAQMLVADVVERDGVWCFDLNDQGDKALKNRGSRRLVPIHQRLLDIGVLGFVEVRRKSGETRMFPSLTYTSQNGYGRNVGRWFNERLLPSLHMKEKGLVFHCFRHSMVTFLVQASVADAVIKALVGHTQVGVTHNHYAKAGYKPEQLQLEINKFTF